MDRNFSILITNDDGYAAEGIHSLARIMKKYGKVTAVAPKRHQSGMGMAVDLGLKQISYKYLGLEDGVEWHLLDGTPASCIKYGLGFPFLNHKPDLVVTGINHGSNASTGSCYSGTLGAAQEAALNGIRAVGVSLNNYHRDADFSTVEELFPTILDSLLRMGPGEDGIYYNINFPDLPASEVKGVRVGHQGRGHWEHEFIPWSPEKYCLMGTTPEALGQSSRPVLEEGEKLYMMVGTYIDDTNDVLSDHWLMQDGYVAIVPHQLYNTDALEIERLRDWGMDMDF